MAALDRVVAGVEKPATGTMIGVRYRIVGEALLG